MFRSVFAAPPYPLRPTIYTPQLFPAHAEDLIGSGVRRSSKEFRRTDLIGSGVRRTSHEFTGRSASIKSTLLLLPLDFQYMECLLRRYSIYGTDVLSQGAPGDFHACTRLLIES